MSQSCAAGYEEAPANRSPTRYSRGEPRRPRRQSRCTASSRCCSLVIEPDDDDATTGEPRSARTIDPRAPEDFDGKTSTDVVALAPGLRINQYELIRELGRGGMGQVFLARDTKLGRRVAMKFLTSSSPKFTERFVVEARATARCSHENIVVIHDVAELQGCRTWCSSTSRARRCRG